MKSTDGVRIPETDEERRAMEDRAAQREASLRESGEAERDELRRQLELSCEIAEASMIPTDVKAHVRRQMGAEILVACCPHCGEQAALSGEGKHLCRRCHRWLRYRRDS